MIEIDTFNSDNFYTTGFNVSESEPLNISVTKGSLHFHERIINEDDEEVKEWKEYPIEAFDFDIESDSDFDVVYDCQIVKKDGNLHPYLQRTVLAGADTVPQYQGDSELIHTVLTAFVPANVNTLYNIQVTARKVNKEGENNETST